MALDGVKAICTDCGASKEWNAYEDYLLACLYNQADAYDQGDPIELPELYRKGSLSITRRWEERKEEIKNLTLGITEIGEAIKSATASGKKGKEAAISVLVRPHLDLIILCISDQLNILCQDNVNRRQKLKELCLKYRKFHQDTRGKQREPARVVCALNLLMLSLTS